MNHENRLAYLNFYLNFAAYFSIKFHTTDPRTIGIWHTIEEVEFLFLRFSQHPSGLSLFVTSTFGNGDPPRMAEKMAEWIDKEMNAKQDAFNEEVCLT